MDDNWEHMSKSPMHSIMAEKQIIDVAFPQVKGEYINNILKARLQWFYHVLSIGVH